MAPVKTLQIQNQKKKKALNTRLKGTPRTRREQDSRKGVTQN